MAREGSANEGSVVSRRTRRIKTYQMFLSGGRVTRWNDRTFAGRDERGTGRGRFDRARSGVDARPAIDRSRFHFCPPCTPMSSARRIVSYLLLTSSYPREKTSLLTGSTTLWIASVRFDFLPITHHKKILFRNRLIRTIFLQLCIDILTNCEIFLFYDFILFLLLLLLYHNCIE